MRAIDADHLKRWILSRVFRGQLKVADVIDQIDREDTIEPERKKGEWIDDNCSECGFYVHHGDMRNYCPNCGAKMNGGNQNE